MLVHYKFTILAIALVLESFLLRHVNKEHNGGDGKGIINIDPASEGRVGLFKIQVYGIAFPLKQ